ncbi:MAG: plastocyanin [Candidatus Saccharibacteria bacterium]|nr:plastocyanin [Candidatus Saccharibacteria bacterium]
MRKGIIISAVALVVVAGGVIIYTNRDSLFGSSNSTMPPMPTSSSTATQSTNSVAIQNFAFSPSAITIKKGTTVTWTNQDSTAHTVTETDSQDGPKSGNLSTGKSYSFTYNTVGTFKYECSIHTSMTGTVTVTE